MSSKKPPRQYPQVLIATRLPPLGSVASERSELETSRLETSKLDGFHARSLREILGIRHSFWSRVSNQTVLDRLSANKLSLLLLEQQLLYFGKIARSADNSIIRRMIFKENSLEPSKNHILRRRGRPRLSWISEVHGHALAVTSRLGCNLEDIIFNEI